MIGPDEEDGTRTRPSASGGEYFRTLKYGTDKANPYLGCSLVLPYTLSWACCSTLVPTPTLFSRYHFLFLSTSVTLISTTNVLALYLLARNRRISSAHFLEILLY
jgi:hypothetical protein